ncbi:MAG: hypothetical protein EAZ81_08675 [Verrucomicrobia bacterium]|nr:MAG: hypothetical protein EAZ81_08675 [Verrucomicrobiota bacterium]
MPYRIFVIALVSLAKMFVISAATSLWLAILARAPRQPDLMTLVVVGRSSTPEFYKQDKNKINLHKWNSLAIH